MAAEQSLLTRQSPCKQLPIDCPIGMLQYIPAWQAKVGSLLHKAVFRRSHSDNCVARAIKLHRANSRILKLST